MNGAARNPSLAAFQDAFARALVAGAPPPDPAVAGLVAQPAFAVYRNTVTKGCIDALQANFPAVARLVGEEWFRAAAAGFVELLEERRKRPPAYWGGDDHKELRDKVMEDLKGFFRPEFLNRVDEIVIFNPLSEALLREIVRYPGGEDEEVPAGENRSTSCSPTGRRSTSRRRDTIRSMAPVPSRGPFSKEILNPLALKLLDGTFGEGDLVEVEYVDDRIVFHRRAVAEAVS